MKTTGFKFGFCDDRRRMMVSKMIAKQIWLLSLNSPRCIQQQVAERNLCTGLYGQKRWQATKSASAYSSRDKSGHIRELKDGLKASNDGDSSNQHLDRPNFAIKPKINVENEQQVDFLPNSQARGELEAALERYSAQVTDIPIIIGDEEIRSGEARYQSMPFNHRKKVAKFYHASSKQIEHAIKVALDARREWECRPLEERAEIFLRAADLMSEKYRMDLLATTMLGQGKNIFQAEIDAACEMIDFMRFNAKFALDLYDYQPISSARQTVNSYRFRGLEGFVAAISPFNFTAIGGNLAFASALMGNVVLWKPSDTSVLSNYVTFKIMREAGIPAGVVNFIPSAGAVFGKEIVQHSELAGINFTGSVPTFRFLWKEVGKHLDSYRTFPRLVGEVGGKNYHLIHPSADLQTSLNATIRAAFEYSGQKCSACSRLYVPASLWNDGFRAKLVSVLESEMKVGSPIEYDTFMSAVIDENSFDRIKKYIDAARADKNEVELLVGGRCDKTDGYFIQPSVLVVKNPKHKLMQEEIFGPVLTTFVYDDAKMSENEVLELVAGTSPFGLTGAVFAQDQAYIEKAMEALKNTAGNFYINDKSTGAVVNQQPFGGARLSGTNDKAGGPHYLLRWASPQTIKDTRSHPTLDWKYPYMAN